MGQLFVGGAGKHLPYISMPEECVQPEECGNGLIDPGEDCDCGSFPDNICSRKCCNMAKCKIFAGYECATGLCCDLNICKHKPARDICREVQDDCDIVDECDGSSSLCKDLHKQDGTMCLNRYFFLNGICLSRNRQCSLLWSDNRSVSAGEACYLRNKLTTNGCFNCDYDSETNIAQPCDFKDRYCGKLLCAVSHSAVLNKHNHHHVGLSCVCSLFYVRSAGKHFSYVSDGTRCDTNKVYLIKMNLICRVTMEQKSRQIFTSNFAVYIADENHMHKKVHKLKLDCHYQGHVDGNQSQVAVLSLCSSVSGFYQRDNEVFEVMSKQKGSLDAVVVKKVDVPRSSFCGVRNTLMASRKNLKNVKKMVPVERNVTATLDREIRIVKIFVAVDYDVLSSFDGILTTFNFFLMQNSFFKSDVNITVDFLLNAFIAAILSRTRHYDNHFGSSNLGFSKNSIETKRYM
ncbi:hypothetical protein HELRODRAFT_180002 [Helobdella robusta]|uniref:Disintegrin domain-containing protein n=1 Tax=Helobdella robusta TaxID=6412 RepID=T1FFB7_HELRO|nr:hypothetical protein HELRODRAFT_180002 [Helobdella robusta]ESN94897.1 hypothetical protein HELRODRAFT_180002 [Helobdella robusta]